MFRPTPEGTYRSCRENAKPSPRADLGAGAKYPGELAVLHLPQSNDRWDLVDGSYIEIRGREGVAGSFLVDCHHTFPTASRRQINHHVRGCRSLESAIETAEQWLAQHAK